MNESTKEAVRPARPSLILGAAHLAALWSLAFLQPMLSLLGKNPEFFVARGNTSGQIITYTLVLAFGPPLIGLLIEAVAQLVSKNLRWGIHLVLMTVVGACFLLTLLKGIFDWPAGILIAFSLLLSAGGVFAYTRWSFPRSFMDVLTPAPIVILVIFFFFTSTSRLILPREQPDPVDVAIENPSPVVMVIFDEFPLAALMDKENQIDGTRYPAFADLASTSTWYENATGAAAYTPMAVPAIFTGTTPSNDDLPIAEDHPRSIFTLLGNSYDLRVSETATQICPPDLCPDSAIATGEAKLSDLFSDLDVVSQHLLLPDSMRRNLPDVSKSFSEFSNESESATSGPVTGVTGETGTTGPTGESTAQPVERTGQGAARKLGRLFALRSSEDEITRIKKFTDNFENGQNETLDLIHVEKPHYPWRHIPDGQRYTNLTGEWNGLLPNDGPWMAPPKIVDIALQRHLLEVGYVDTLLGLITDELKAKGLWDEATVVVTADHGSAFLSRIPRRAAVQENMGEIASVPLFFKAPGQTKPEVVSEHRCATDILPQIAGQLGIDYPWDEVECPADEVTVLNSPRGEGTATLDQMESQRQVLVNRIQRVFGTDVGWGPTYRFGPHKDLIGSKVSQLNANTDIASHRMRAEPERRNPVKEYEPNSPSVLGLLQKGYLQNVDDNRVLAVAVDDRIEAVGWTFKDGFGFGPGYSILLPPESLKKGFNKVDIYLVEDNGKKLTIIYDGSKKPDGSG
ncbi:MAG: sulfatase-like hydrolase/transferase [Solirubrobacterales bacterium]